ncbi:MAG: DnaJ domain-containing protein [Proteobacteria bacterium]|nr:DnaJ domain-containing protein [Pseudomonadota bacterium]
MKNYYEILKIPKNATAVEIRDAYLNLAKLFHPDKAKSVTNEGWVSTNDNFAFVTEAYRVLIDPARRNEYDKKLRMGIKDEGDVYVEQHFTKIFKEGISSIGKKEYKKAVEYFKACIKIKPNHAESNSFLALAIMSSGGDPNEALSYATKALEEKIDNADLYVNIALIYKSMGNEEKYKSNIKQALQWNPSNKRALMEKKKIDEASKGNIFSKIFKGGRK